MSMAWAFEASNEWNHHTTVIYWVKSVGQHLMPMLHKRFHKWVNLMVKRTFVGAKKNKMYK